MEFGVFVYFLTCTSFRVKFPFLCYCPFTTARKEMSVSKTRRGELRDRRWTDPTQPAESSDEPLAKLHECISAHSWDCGFFPTLWNSSTFSVFSRKHYRHLRKTERTFWKKDTAPNANCDQLPSVSFGLCVSFFPTWRQSSQLETHNGYSTVVSLCGGSSSFHSQQRKQPLLENRTQRWRWTVLAHTVTTDISVLISSLIC